MPSLEQLYGTLVNTKTFLLHHFFFPSSDFLVCREKVNFLHSPLSSSLPLPFLPSPYLLCPPLYSSPLFSLPFPSPHLLCPPFPFPPLPSCPLPFSFHFTVSIQQVSNINTFFVRMNLGYIYNFIPNTQMHIHSSQN